MRYTHANWLLVLVAFVLALLPASSMAAQTPVLLGAWQAAEIAPGAGALHPPMAARVPVELHAFDTRHLVRLPRNSHGNWVRLSPRDGHWPGGDWALAIEQPGMAHVTLFGPGQPINAQSLDGLGDQSVHTPGQLTFMLHDLHGSQPIWLYFSPDTWLGTSMHFALRSPHVLARNAANWLAFISSALTVLVTMSLIALWFGILLHDRTYLLYATYVLGYATLSAVSSGFAFHPLELHWVAADPAMVARVAGGVAGAASVLFAASFADLRGYVPRSRHLLSLLASLFGAIVVLSLMPWQSLRMLGAWLQDPTVVLAGPLMLALLVIAWRRGSRYAGFFLIGWTPLVVLTVCDSLQSFDLLQSWNQLQQYVLAAAAFEALVLIAGLADRTLATRRSHSHALRMAEMDALTGTLNRGALLSRMRQLLDAGEAPMSVLFIDLDRFKHLNDLAGHQAGDQALVALVNTLQLELRERDQLGRYGGEEFMVLLPGQSLSQALGVAERLLETVRTRRLRVHPDLPNLTISIGAAEARPGESIAQLLERADQAMYAAKHNGRDQVQSEPLVRAASGAQ